MNEELKINLTIAYLVLWSIAMLYLLFRRLTRKKKPIKFTFMSYEDTCTICGKTFKLGYEPMEYAVPYCTDVFPYHEFDKNPEDEVSKILEESL